MVPAPISDSTTPEAGPSDLKGKSKALMDTFSTLKRERTFRDPSDQKPDYPALHELVAPHIESFNALFEGGANSKGQAEKGLLELGVQDIKPRVIFDGRGRQGERGNRLEIRVDSVTVARPMLGDKDRMATERRIFPSEARERLTTYSGRMTAKLSWTVNGGNRHTETRDLGMLPIMVKSARCNIRGFSPAQLVGVHEESEEMGGYFIINGNERLIRFLIVPRRDHVIALVRPSFANRGTSYTPYGVQIRSVRPDQTSQTNTMHYLSNGGVTLRFSWRKNEYMVPAIMIIKALVSASDKEIFLGILQNDFENTFLTDRVEMLLRGFKTYNLYTGQQCLQYLGDKFRVVLGCPEDWSNEAVGEFLLDRIVLVHLKTNRDKFRVLLFMIRKLYALVGGECGGDNPDSPQHQEILMPGYLYSMIIKEKVEEILTNVRTNILQDIRKQVSRLDFFDSKYIMTVVNRINCDVGQKMQYFLATGNLLSPSGLDLQQAAGFTIVAEKLNFYRYISHFRSVHRGAFFTELRTTTVRKLLPESWGFLCPVHTPDGSPCGLLNHFAHKCGFVVTPLSVGHIPGLLSSLGMTQPFDPSVNGRMHICVQLDGQIIGWATPKLAKTLAVTLRTWKTEGVHDVPLDLEIGLVPKSKGGQYPGLYLFSGRARMMRPVKYLPTGKVDHVGPFEQVYLDIACVPDEIEAGVTTHVEMSPTHVLSLLANLTPFSDFNQSPRNMYQCQMSKQTMGTPSTVYNHRTDNKLYRLQTGQTPIVRPKLHDHYGMDGFPNGTNAVVAVISYTGYDMEDAMILNKSAHERGFGHGTVYKSQIVDLKAIRGGKSSAAVDLEFGIGPDVHPQSDVRETVDDDGLPLIGTLLKRGDPLCAYYDRTEGKTKFEKYKGDEKCFVDEVRLIGNDSGKMEAAKLHVKLRIPRAPVIGDKFSSRHGQKGVCSQKWPAVDMPFTESGMQPDVIINPHAFPSRMTIGMFVESLAGKAGAMHGIAQDATPFQFSEDDTPVDYFGEQLLNAGYNYFGNEPMYSGITGQEFPADIYIGVVYYQRLRHMVGDKWQVRTTGPVDKVTQQPIKGRKRGGGIRFGEMERDALLAHGTSFLLQDRLMNCSDYSTAWVCRTCGSIISLAYDDVGLGTDIGFGKGDVGPRTGPNGEYCRICRSKDVQSGPGADQTNTVRFTIGDEAQKLGREGDMDIVAMPYVMKFLCAELASMGINLSLGVK